MPHDDPTWLRSEAQDTETRRAGAVLSVENGAGIREFLRPLMETSLRYWVELADRTINSSAISFN